LLFDHEAAFFHLHPLMIFKLLTLHLLADDDNFFAMLILFAFQFFFLSILLNFISTTVDVPNQPVSARLF